MASTKIYLRDPFFIKDNFKKPKVFNTLNRPFKKLENQFQFFYPTVSFFDESPLKPLEISAELIPNLVMTN
jgi:hypothetical protein